MVNYLIYATPEKALEMWQAFVDCMPDCDMVIKNYFFRYVVNVIPEWAIDAGRD